MLQTDYSGRGCVTSNRSFPKTVFAGYHSHDASEYRRLTLLRWDQYSELMPSTDVTMKAPRCPTKCVATELQVTKATTGVLAHPLVSLPVTRGTEVTV